MLKPLTLALLLTTPAAAWEFRPTPICTLTDGTTTFTDNGLEA